MANELSFITRVDLSGIKAGMEGAASVVQTGSEKMAVAMSRANLEQKAFNDSLKQLGPLAAAGNQQAVAAIAEHIESLAAAKEAVAALKVAVDAETSSELGNTAAVRSGIGARQAASAELRVFQGGIEGSTRAAGAFLTNVAGLSSVIEVAFPVFGAIALGEVLVDVGSKIVDLYDKFFTFKELREEVAKEAIQDAVKIGSALSETAQLRHTTGMRDNPIGTLKKDIADAGTQLDGLTRKAQIAHDSLAESLTTKESGNYLGHGTSEEENEQNIIARRSALATINSEIDKTRAKIGDLSSELNQQETKATKKDDSAASKAAELLLHRLEHQFEEMGNVAPGQAAAFWSKYIHAFDAYGNAAISESNSVMEKYNRAIQAALKQDAEPGKLGKQWKEEQEKMALIGANGEAARAGLDAVNKALTQQGEDALRTGGRWDSYWAEVARGNETATQAEQSLVQTQIAVELAEGHITKLAAAEQLAAAHSQAYKERISELREELEKLHKEGAGLQPGDAGYEQNAARQQTVQNQITQVSGQAAASRVTDNGNIENQITQPFKSAFNTVNNDFLQVQGKMIIGTQSISRDFANMGVSILTSTASWAERWLAKHAEVYVADKVLHTSTEAAKLTAEQAANATRVASTAATQAAVTAAVTTTNVGQVLSYAAVAAAAAAAAEAGIPFVGPALAAAAAAATYTATAAYAPLAAFETGGIIPNTGVALVHQGEAVIPAPLTNLLLGAASMNNTNNSSSSASMTQNFHGTMSDSKFRRLATRNANHMVGVVRRGLRDQGKS